MLRSGGRFAPGLAEVSAPDARRTTWLGTRAKESPRSEPEASLPPPPAMSPVPSEARESPATAAEPRTEATGGFMRWALLSALGAAVAIWLGDRRR